MPRLVGWSDWRCSARHRYPSERGEQECAGQPEKAQGEKGSEGK